MQTIQSQPITVPAISQPVTWQTDFSFHIACNYRNAKTSALIHQHIRVFALWYEAKFNRAFEPSLLTNYDLIVYREWSLSKEKVEANTWNSRLWALGILCAWIQMPVLLDGIEMQDPGVISEKHRSLTDDEYHRLVHKLEQDVINHKINVTVFDLQTHNRIWASVMLGLHGLRVEEVSLLEVGDITLNERSGWVKVRNGKGGKKRIVNINRIGRNALASFLAIRPVSTSNNLFQVHKRTLQRSVETLGAQIGVPDMTFHWLRYTFAKRLEREGQPLAKICQLTGHGSIGALQRYLRSSAEELQSAVEGVM